MRVVSSVFVLLFVSLFIACSDNEDSIEINSLKLLLNKDLFNVNESITITVLSDKGEDVTKIVNILVDKVAINSSEFMPKKYGNYTICAKYGESIVSNTAVVTVLDKTATFKNHPIVEAFVHSKCSYCPRVHYAIDLVEEKTDAVIPIVYHPYTRDSWIDILYNKESLQLFEIMRPKDKKTVPQAFLNRNIEGDRENNTIKWRRWTYPEPNNIDEVVGLTYEQSPIGIVLKMDNSQHKVTVDYKISITKDFDNPLNMVVYLLESKILQDQPNRYTYYDSQNPIKNFEHNNVFRFAPLGVWGQKIPFFTTKNTLLLEDKVVFDMPKDIFNIENLSVVVAVVDSVTKQVLNARIVRKGEKEQFFEFY